MNNPFTKLAITEETIEQIIAEAHLEQKDVNIAEYVLILCSRYHATKEQYQVLVVLKNRPEWQAGKYNLIGGKVEDELPDVAAKRELFEEAGLKASKMVLMGTLHGETEKEGVVQSNIIYCFKALLEDGYAALEPRPEETEPVFWMSMEDVLNNKRLMPNLRVIIPMMQ
jgi:8-oxo-dGTP pyrophosphatase MutT (NUDIX family)